MTVVMHEHVQQSSIFSTIISVHPNNYAHYSGYSGCGDGGGCGGGAHISTTLNAISNVILSPWRNEYAIWGPFY